jgi:Fe-S oxidoreductase/nitrate reductase gamma subunit
MESVVASNVAHRAMYWHINAPYKFMIYPLVAVAMAIAAYGFYQKFMFIYRGAPDNKRFGSWWQRIKLFILDVPLQARVLSDWIPGAMHVFIFWSFMALMFTTFIVFLDVDFKFSIYHGPFYLGLTLLSDLAGLAMIAGVVIAGVRRYIIKPDRLDNQWDDALFLGILFFIGVTGFVLEGLRIHYAGDPWAMWSPGGYLVSLGMGNMQEATVTKVYQSLWWTHFSIMFVFFAVFPYTKMMHIFTTPANIFFSWTGPKGALPRVDIEAMLNDEKAAENFNVGVSAVKDLTWKNRLDYEACLRCGRCQDNCPAHLNQHPLSPKKFIQDMKKFAENPANSVAVSPGEGQPAELPLVVGKAVEPDAIWECRTCRGCMEVCPARNEHIPQIMELRRAEVMMRGQLPQDAAVALKLMERTGNPFGPQDSRSQWITDTQIPVIKAGEECEALFWIGCCTTFDPMKQKVAYNVLKILMKAGVNVACMGDEEMCCGDPARVLGDENLFQSTVKNQIELIKSRKFKYIVCHCPHCLNVIRNEWPQFGADFKVLHHTEVFNQLINEGRLKLTMPIDKKVTYHDPCYLGRYNDIYEEPRNVIKSIKGTRLVEMEHNRRMSRCCGGGGGHYWMDLVFGERLNVSRAKEAFDTEADIIAVSCIYCLQMLNDAVKILNLDEKMRVEDISELVARAMGGVADTQAETEREAEAPAAA